MRPPGLYSRPRQRGLHPARSRYAPCSAPRSQRRRRRSRGRPPKRPQVRLRRPPRLRPQPPMWRPPRLSRDVCSLVPGRKMHRCRTTRHRSLQIRRPPRRRDLLPQRLWALLPRSRASPGCPRVPTGRPPRRPSAPRLRSKGSQRGRPSAQQAPQRLGPQHLVAPALQPLRPRQQRHPRSPAARLEASSVQCSPHLTRLQLFETTPSRLRRPRATKHQRRVRTGSRIMAARLRPQLRLLEGPSPVRRLLRRRQSAPEKPRAACWARLRSRAIRVRWPMRARTSDPLRPPRGHR